MAHIIFYTKPGCGGAVRQKALLAASGHTVEERSLFDAAWTPDTLRPYLEGLDVAEWYNLSAPAVKAGAVIPGALPAGEALEQLCGDPILIKRPLMQIGGQLMAGFNTEALGRVIPLRDTNGENLSACQMPSDNPCV